MKRSHYCASIAAQFRIHPICAILGPRQVGKTTLSQEFARNTSSESIYTFDLENPLDISRLDNPMLTLSPLMKPGALIIIDEIQRRPELFPILRVLTDKNPETKFLILGSASRDLLQQSSETLAGRIGYLELFPFSYPETHNQTELWLRGGFPRSYLASSINDSNNWRAAYIRTFLERDIPTLGINTPAAEVYRFWMMLCHYHGQTANLSAIANSLKTTDYMVRKYLDILAGTFMIRLLQPWYENISKRQVKSPKVYFRDSGILNTLAGVQSMDQLHSYPRLGAFWEGFALEEVIRFYQKPAEECFFWGTQAKAELDLFIIHHGKRIGFEFKYTDSPKMTPSMHIAHQDLQLDHLFVIHPGIGNFPLTEKTTAYGLEEFLMQNKLPSEI